VKPCPGCPNCSPDPEPEFLTAWSRSDKVSIGTGTAPLPQSARMVNRCRSPRPIESARHETYDLSKREPDQGIASPLATGRVASRGDMPGLVRLPQVCGLDQMYPGLSAAARSQIGRSTEPQRRPRRRLRRRELRGGGGGGPSAYRLPAWTISLGSGYPLAPIDRSGRRYRWTMATILPARSRYATIWLTVPSGSREKGPGGPSRCTSGTNSPESMRGRTCSLKSSRNSSADSC
jgi:hypothetical protein